MLNAGIILQGQNANVFDRFLEGQQAGRQNALSDLYRTQGAAIAGGDPNAINALAQFDPQAAMGIKRQQFDFAQAQENARLKAEEYKRSVSAAEAAATAAEVEKAVKMGLSARSAQEWDAMVSQFAPDLVGQFQNREAIAQSYMSFADILKRNEPGDPTKGAPTGYMWQDPNNPAAGVSLIPGYTPKNGTALSVGPDGTVTFNQGGYGSGAPIGQDPANTGTPRDGGKFAVKLSENDAAALAASQQAAASASQLESIAAQLETLSPQVGYTGPGGALYGAVDDALGVLPGDSGSRGAFKSLGLEAQLSFTEKTKGAITDREMATFKAAVPGLSQTPEANKTISQVIRAGAARVQSKHNFMEAWARKYGSLEGSEAVWQDFMRENPIIEGGPGGVNVRQDGDWQGYLNRKPTMAYTPETIMGLSIEELSQVPIEQMTPQQLDALERRYNELGQ